MSHTKSTKATAFPLQNSELNWKNNRIHHHAPIFCKWYGSMWAPSDGRDWRLRGEMGFGIAETKAACIC